MPQRISNTNPAEFCAYIDAGITLFPCCGYTKTPARKGYMLTSFDPEFVPQDRNYGAILRNRYLVIDCDPRHYTQGDKPLTRLLNELQLPADLFKDTFVVKTPSGGAHVYFAKSPDVELVKSLKEFPGLEFKTDKIMACGCYNEDHKKRYVRVFNSLSSVMKAPQILLARLLKPEVKEVQLDNAVVTDNPADIGAYIQYCQSVVPAIEGQSGDLRTYQAACRGRDLGLSAEKTYEILAEHFNPRCEPPWDEAQLRLKVGNAYQYSTRDPAGIKSVTNAFTELKKTDVKVRYHLDHHGLIKRSMHNLKMFFDYPAMLDDRDGGVKKTLSVPPIGNSLALDQFSHRIVWTRPAPWYKSTADWSDEDAVEFKSILSEQMALDFATPLIHEVATVCANRRAFHPVKDYLAGCHWDGVRRLDSWLSMYCGALDNKYTRFVGRKILIAAVARIFEPGCKFDHVFVAEGIQGLGKSWMWNILASPWFTDAPLNIQDKSAIEVMQGKWIIELAEMDALNKYESQTIKGFLTRTEDRCRLAWGRMTKNFPRQNIFVGSVNPEITGWLKDRTGNRRYWPVTVTKIDLDGLKFARDALWAEAVMAYKTGEKIYVDSREMFDMMHAEVESRMQEDPWFYLIEEHLHSKAGDYVVDGKIIVTPIDLFNRCIGGGAAAFRLPEANRIASVLKILGFEKTRSHARLGYVYMKNYEEEL